MHTLRMMLRTLWLATLWLASAAATSPIASRPNHLLGPRFLRFYVADIPPEYSYLRAFDDPYRFPHSPLDHLGPLQHPESVQYSTYNSDYNRGDRAFWHALTSSPLRVATPDHADFVYVPIFWLLLNESFMQPFMDNAFTHLPLLGQKPHVVVLARPRHEHTKNNDPVTNHEHAKHFIFLTPVVPNIFSPGVMSLPNYVTYPYFHVVHWSLYTMLQKQAFDPGAVAASKDTLIMQSFVVRPIEHEGLPASLVGSRHLQYLQCKQANESDCRHVDWDITFQSNMHLLQRLYERAYFFSQPVADWITRCSYVDGLAAGSVPIFPLADMGPYLPFTDVLDWRDWSEVVTGDELAEAGCTCQQDGAVHALEMSVEAMIAGQASPALQCHCPNTTFVDVLRKRYPTTASLLKKLQAVWHVRQVFQFASNPSHLTLRWDAVHRLDPLDDAFTFSIKALMRKLCELGHSDKCRGREYAVEQEDT